MSHESTIAALTKRIECLEAESEVRRVQMRYMFLCDTPLPEYGVKDDAERIDLILELFAKEGVWEASGNIMTGSSAAPKAARPCASISRISGAAKPIRL